MSAGNGIAMQVVAARRPIPRDQHLCIRSQASGLPALCDQRNPPVPSMGTTVCTIWGSVWRAGFVGGRAGCVGMSFAW